MIKQSSRKDTPHIDTYARSLFENVLSTLSYVCPLIYIKLMRTSPFCTVQSSTILTVRYERSRGFPAVARRAFLDVVRGYRRTARPTGHLW